MMQTRRTGGGGGQGPRMSRQFNKSLSSSPSVRHLGLLARAHVVVVRWPAARIDDWSPRFVEVPAELLMTHQQEVTK